MKKINVINHTDSHALFYDLHSHPDERARPYIKLREAIEGAGYVFEPTFDGSGAAEAEAVLSLCRINKEVFENISALPLQRRFICVMEPPVQLPQLYDERLKEIFGTIFVLFDDLVDDRSYFKFFHHQARERQIAPIPSFEEKKFCVMVQSNFTSPHPQELYSERRRLANFFVDDARFDLYGGAGWDSFPNSKGRWEGDKLELIKNYKFMICYENMKDQYGYMTERIFEAFYGGTVPIYWGASNITDYVPASCFIDRRAFSSNQELLAHLETITRADYDTYLAAARAYLASPEAKRHFSPESFGRRLLSTIQERIEHAHYS